VEVALALLAACAFGLGNVLQQKGALEAPADRDDPRFLVQILHRRVWLAGAVSQLIGWVLQAAALNIGSLLVVQALTSLNLVISLPLGVWITDQRLSRRTWAGAGAVTLGIIVFLTAGSPGGGSSKPAPGAWGTAVFIAVVTVAFLDRAGRRRSGATSALLFGCAAGICIAFQAAVTKAFLPLVGEGIRAIVSSWTIYALIASALLGFVYQQVALKSGVLAPAIGASNAATLAGSVVLGAAVFGESVAGNGDWFASIAGLCLALGGIFLLGAADTSNESSVRSC
jgi:drug/metabolite transporter (DMT)-like permease